MLSRAKKQNPSAGVAL